MVGGGWVVCVRVCAGRGSRVGGAWRVLGGKVSWRWLLVVRGPPWRASQSSIHINIHIYIYIYTHFCLFIHFSSICL